VGDVHNFERLAAVAAQNKPSRHSDTPILNAPHSRRRCFPEDREWGDLVDREDKLRLIISPESEYAIAGANALGRAIDDIIIAAATGNATDGDGVAVAHGAGQQIASDFPVATEVGLTLGKVIEAGRLLNAAEVYEEDRFLIYGAQQLSEVLAIEQFTSADYATSKALHAGHVAQFLGFTWIRSERLLTDTGTDITTCLAFQRQGIGLAVNENMFARIAERPDKSFGHQVYCRMTMGAVRIEEAAVVDIQCNNSP
jgi:hypothetical protein